MFEGCYRSGIERRCSWGAVRTPHSAPKCIANATDFAHSGVRATTVRKYSAGAQSRSAIHMLRIREPIHCVNQYMTGSDQCCDASNIVTPVLHRVLTCSSPLPLVATTAASTAATTKPPFMLWSTMKYKLKCYNIRCLSTPEGLFLDHKVSCKSQLCPQGV